MITETKEELGQKAIISPDELLAHWQGHRNLTRRAIEAFPEKEFFEFSISGMRTFAELSMELIGIGAPALKEIVSKQPRELQEDFDHGNSKAKILELWDANTLKINEYWAQISPERFRETVLLFGKYEDTVIASVFYFIDNEIHHRGQAYVYLRSLGITPPFFWER